MSFSSRNNVSNFDATHPKEQRAEAYYLASDVADRSAQKKRPSTTPHQRQGDRGSDDDDDAAPRQTVNRLGT